MSTARRDSGSSLTRLNPFKLGLKKAVALREQPTGRNTFTTPGTGLVQPLVGERWFGFEIATTKMLEAMEGGGRPSHSKIRPSKKQPNQAAPGPLDELLLCVTLAYLSLDC